MKDVVTSEMKTETCSPRILMYLIDGMSMAVVFTMHLLRQMRMFWPNCKRNVHEPDILESEIRTAISKIKSQKSPGIDGILKAS